jgi:hypothetical protein
LNKISNSNLELNVTIGFEKRQAYLFVKMIPYVKVGNVLKRVLSCTIQIETNNVFELPKYLSKTNYAANSVLANGQWYKIAAMNNAVHRIDYTFLKKVKNLFGLKPMEVNELFKNYFEDRYGVKVKTVASEGGYNLPSDDLDYADPWLDNED